MDFKTLEYKYLEIHVKEIFTTSNFDHIICLGVNIPESFRAKALNIPLSIFNPLANHQCRDKTSQ